MFDIWWKGFKTLNLTRSAYWYRDVPQDINLRDRDSTVKGFQSLDLLSRLKQSAFLEDLEAFEFDSIIITEIQRALSVTARLQSHLRFPASGSNVICFCIASKHFNDSSGWSLLAPPLSLCCFLFYVDSWSGTLPVKTIRFLGVYPMNWY